MRLIPRVLSVLVLILLASPVVLLKGCGDLDNEEMCPGSVTMYSSCENWANYDDTVSGPASDSITLSAAYAGQSIPYVPLIYTVKDKTGVPRNHVCVDFWTDGYFFADKGYTTLILLPNITLRTNDRGVICVYWATNNVGASGTSGSSFVNAMSGTTAQLHEFTVDWTVE